MHDIYNETYNLKNFLIDIRRAIHKNPEISFNEKNTSKLIKKILKENNIFYVEMKDSYGLVAIINEYKNKPCIAFRCDMDALEITERNDVEYRSQNHGVMHACGHDGHISIAIGLSLILNKYKEQLKGKVKIIFQPSEEKSPLGGAKGILKSGILEDVDVIYGLHMWPELDKGKFLIKDGPIMSSSDHFKIDIIGKSSHAAIPNKGIDSIVIASEYITSLQSIISRKIDPKEPAVITIGRIEGGERYNVLPQSCFIEGTVRALNKDVRDLIENNVKERLKNICDFNGANYKIEYQRGYNVVVNDKKSSDFIKRIGVKIFGEENIKTNISPSMIGEDFCYYLDSIPGAFIWFGTKDEKFNSPLHSSSFNFDDSILWKAVYLFSTTALEYLGK